MFLAMSFDMTLFFFYIQFLMTFVCILDKSKSVENLDQVFCEYQKLFHLRPNKLCFQAKRGLQSTLMREFLLHLSTSTRRCRKDTLTQRETILSKRKNRLEITGLTTSTG